MISSHRLISPLLVSIFLLITGGQVWADSVVVYSTFGPGEAFDPNGGYVIAGLGLPGTQYTSVAAAFTPSATYSLDAVAFAAFGFAATNGPAMVDLLLTNDSGGQPDSAHAPLETFTSIIVTNPQAGTFFLVSSSAHPLLKAGNTYWLIMQMTDPNTDGEVAWDLASPQNITGPAAVRHSPTGTWNNYLGQPAFEILGNPAPIPTPEPSSLLLIAAGLFALRLRLACKGLDCLKPSS